MAKTMASLLGGSEVGDTVKMRERLVRSLVPPLYGNMQSAPQGNLRVW